jgi:hypothetical protein
VEILGTADGDILEIEVKAHRRRYHRQRYRRTCTCPNQPAVITAPPPDKVIPKSTIGISLWVLILLRKFLFYHRSIAWSPSCAATLCISPQAPSSAA